MASKNNHGYKPETPIDWKELLQFLSAYHDTTEADHKAGRISNYINDLEYCLGKANDAIRYYKALIQNYDRLVTVMEESRNQAFDFIGRLRDEIAIAKKYQPLADGAAFGIEKGDSDE